MKSRGGGDYVELAAELALAAQLDVDTVVEREADKIERLLDGAAQLDVSVSRCSLHAPMCECSDRIKKKFLSVFLS
jgi:hypothetical protein